MLTAASKSLQCTRIICSYTHWHAYRIFTIGIAFYYCDCNEDTGEAEGDYIKC